MHTCYPIQRISPLLLLVLMLANTSCSERSEELDLHCVVNGCQNCSLQLQFLTYTSTSTLFEGRTDSTGYVNFRLRLDEPGIYGLKTDEGNYWLFSLDNRYYEVSIDPLQDDDKAVVTQDVELNQFLSGVTFMRYLWHYSDSSFSALFSHGLHPRETPVADEVNMYVSDTVLNRIMQDPNPFTSVLLARWIHSHVTFSELGTVVSLINERLPESSYAIELTDIYRRLASAMQQAKGFSNTSRKTESEENADSSRSVRINDQVWMGRNLNLATVNSWCLDDLQENCDTYGRMYNWYDALNACPEGWHLPSDEEWITLERTLGMPELQLYGETWRGTDQGGQLKAVSILWDRPNTDATDIFGFSAIPGGPRYKFGMYGTLGKNATFWTSTAYGKHDAVIRYLGYNKSEIGRTVHSKLEGHSVRCLKD